MSVLDPPWREMKWRCRTAMALARKLKHIKPFVRLDKSMRQTVGPGVVHLEQNSQLRAAHGQVLTFLTSLAHVSA